MPSTGIFFLFDFSSLRTLWFCSHTVGWLRHFADRLLSRSTMDLPPSLPLTCTSLSLSSKGVEIIRCFFFRTLDEELYIVAHWLEQSLHLMTRVGIHISALRGASVRGLLSLLLSVLDRC